MKRLFVIAVSFLFLFAIFAGRPVFAGTLRVVTSLDPLEAREYIAAFEKESGVRVQWIRLAAGEALARLQSEAKNPTQDVWFGAPATEFVAARAAGLLEPYSSPATRAIPARWRDPAGYWTGIYFGTIAFISGKGISPPSGWQDLLKEEYRGEIVVSYPYTAGTGYTILAGLVAIMGRDAAVDYYKKLDAQVRRYTKSGGAPIIEVGLGEAGVGIVFEQDAVRKGRSRGFPIAVTIPSDGVPFEIGGAAIIAGRKTPESEAFIDWVVSGGAQGMMHEWFRTPLHPGAKKPEGMHGPQGLNLAPIDIQKAGLERGEIIKLWRERIGK